MGERKSGGWAMKGTDDKDTLTLLLLLLCVCFPSLYSHFFLASVIIPYLRKRRFQNSNNSWNINCLNSIKSLNMIFIENCTVK